MAQRFRLAHVAFVDSLAALLKWKQKRREGKKRQKALYGAGKSAENLQPVSLRYDCRIIGL
jgi:hypothetical protein